jgi:hypothetical protein
MLNSIQIKNAVPSITKSHQRSSPQRGFPRITLALCITGLLFVAVRSVESQACPTNCDSNQNTALGGALVNNTTGTYNTAVGADALLANTSGSNNAATGTAALELNTTGNDNTASGFGSLGHNTFGGSNTATGYEALSANTTGSNNTATGTIALYANTVGSYNTAQGYSALFGNTTGTQNVANGAYALSNSSTGNHDTASGYAALYSNTTGSDNAANGNKALYGNTTGAQNTAVGNYALQDNTTGNVNAALGLNALISNMTGSGNAASGVSALYNNSTGSNNTASGYNALENNTTGGSNIGVGQFAGSNLTTGSNNIDIGNNGVAAEANTIRVGTQGTQTATFIAGIRGVPIAAGRPVEVSASGQLGVRASSARFKKAIKSMGEKSEAILALRPVSFRYKKELDPTGAPQFGLVAEEVAKIDPDLVVSDDQGKPFSVRYDEVNAMLLNEFLKAHGTIEQQKAIIAQLQYADAEQRQEIKALANTLKQQAAQIQKVSDQLVTAPLSTTKRLATTRPAAIARSTPISNL